MKILHEHVYFMVGVRGIGENSVTNEKASTSISASNVNENKC